jgi:hypothetical protein
MLNDALTTSLARQAANLGSLEAIASLLTRAEASLPMEVNSSHGWHNLAVIAACAAERGSPALALACLTARRHGASVSDRYDQALRDVVICTGGGPLAEAMRHVEVAEPIGRYAAYRLALVALERGDEEALRRCLDRMDSFALVEMEFGHPVLERALVHAMWRKLRGEDIQLDRLCDMARQVPHLWARYCRHIRRLFGGEDSTLCSLCAERMRVRARADGLLRATLSVEE